MKKDHSEFESHVSPQETILDVRDKEDSSQRMTPEVCFLSFWFEQVVGVVPSGEEILEEEGVCGRERNVNSDWGVVSLRYL